MGLCLNIINRAIDDICPIYVGNTEKRIEERKVKFAEIEKIFDDEKALLKADYAKDVAELELAYENNKKFWETSKKNLTEELDTFTKNKNRIKSEKLHKLTGKIKNELDYLEKKFVAEEVTQDSYVREMAIIAEKKESEAQIIKDYYTNTINSREKIINDKIAAITKKEEDFVAKHAEKKAKLSKTLEVKALNIIIEQERKDLIKVALEWFINDFEKVLNYCRKENLNVKDCYLEVKNRLALLGRSSEELEKLIERIDRHDY